MDNFKLFNELLYSQNVKELTDILKKHDLWDNENIWRYYGDIDNNVGQNFWVDSQSYNIVEMTHHIWLVSMVDLISSKLN